MFSTIYFFAALLTVSVFSSNPSFSVNTTVAGKIHNLTENTPFNISKDGKTYFFKYNTNNNQFRIYNRVSVNPVVLHNTSDTPVTKKKALKTANRTSMNELRKFDAFLDEEWKYGTNSGKQFNSSQLPFQVYPFLYNDFVRKTSMKVENGERFPDTTKVIFNKHKNDSMILNFNLGKMNHDHTIRNAEVHFYWHVPENSKFFKESCVLRLYEVENEQNDTIAAKTLDIHKLLNVIYVSKAQTGWQIFRITRKSIETWVNMTGELRLLISISEANQVSSATIFDDSGNGKRLRTFLIIRIDHGENSRDTQEIVPYGNHTRFHGPPKYCSKSEFYLDFRKLHWNKFIIAPEGFMAYDCQGKCTRHNSNIFSNHLKMLTTFQDLDKRTRSPCCVPIEFYSLPIMFYDEIGNVVLKIYKDLIAAKCGCR